MTMIRRADEDCVNVSLLQQLSKICVSPGRREFLMSRCEELLVDIADGHDILVLDAMNILRRPVRRPDDTDV